MSAITIYHNPQCSNSRGALALIREAGIEPTIIHYLQTPPSRAELAALCTACGLTARELMRDKGDLYDSLGLAQAHWTPDQLLDLMAEHPALINRPIVVSEHGARLCRPPERVRELLPPGTPD